ncbi:hypothetical protein [Synechococcus phage BUCT-ZZ01]|nr:hypothetical protein [Synechococcus phage BUCT-ZZ01]
MLETLIAAKDLIKDKKNWCRVNRAQNKKGQYVDPWHRSACQFCAVGAVQKVANYDNNIYTSPEVVLLNNVSRQIFGRAVFMVNDEYGHDEVMQVFDKAIEKLKENESV